MISEPSFQRKKKNPELAYRTNEVLRATNGDSSDSLETDTHFDRETAEGRARLMTQSYPPVAYTTAAPNPTTSPPAAGKATVYNDCEEQPTGHGGNPNPKSTEYRSQYRLLQQAEGANREGTLVPLLASSECQPRKSVSLGAIMQAAGAYGHHGAHNGATTTSPYAHTARDESRKSTGNEDPSGTVDPDEVVTPGKIKKFKTEYKAKFKSPTKYAYVDGNWKKGQQEGYEAEHAPTWYGEVLELRKKAGEYRTRAWEGNMAPENIAKLWEQVSERRVLSALALAAVPSTSKKSDLEEDLVKRAPPTSARHHLERTTPAPGEMGFLLTSPTRDHKLEPAHMHRSMRDEARDAETARISSARSRTSPSASMRIATLATVASRPRTAPAAVRKQLHMEQEAVPKVHAGTKGPKAVVKPAVPKSIQPSAAAPASGQLPKKESHDALLNGDRTPVTDGGTVDKEDIEEPVAIMKSPPEPTRVKSPEQLLVKSPEPVKWTVPLETGSIQWSGSPKIEGDGIKVLREEPRSPPTLTPVLHHSRSPPVVSPVMETAGVLTNGDTKVTTIDGGTSEF